MDHAMPLHRVPAGHRPRCSDAGLARAGYRIGWIAVALAMPCALAIVAHAGMTVAPASAIPMLSCIVLMLSAHGWYRFVAPDARLALATGALGMLVGAGTLAGIISNVGLRLRRPLIDGVLSAADRALGFDTPAIVLAFIGHPSATRLLDWAYLGTLPMCFVVILLLAFRGEAGRTWEAAASFSACIVVSALVSVMHPAIGNFAHARIGAVTAALLPAGSGVYHLPVFRALYAGADPVFDLTRIEGVVTFPSFHLVMALVSAWALRDRGLPGRLAICWGGAVAISTVPIGGHYVVDLLGGIVLWVSVTGLIHALAISGDASPDPCRAGGETSCERVSGRVPSYRTFA